MTYSYIRFKGSLLNGGMFASFLVTFLTLVGCHGQVFNESPDGECQVASPTTVRITATISDMVGASSSELRAPEFKDPTNVEGEQHPFEPLVLPDTQYQREIDYLLLQVYRKDAPDNESPVSSIFYYKLGGNSSLTAAPTSFPGANEVRPFGQGSSVPDGSVAGNTMTFDLELEPGEYECYFFVNDLEMFYIATDQAGEDYFGNPIPRNKAGIKDYRLLDLMGGTGTFLSMQYGFHGVDTDPKLPMFAQDVLVVPRGSYPASRPYVSDRTIHFERVFAKVEFYLTTVQEDNRTEYTNPILEDSFLELANVLIVDDPLYLRFNYAKFVPFDGEYTATDTKLISAGNISSTDIAKVKAGTASSNYGHILDADDYRTDDLSIEKIYQAPPLKYQEDQPRVNDVYIMPLKFSEDAISVADMPRFRFRVRYPGSFDATEYLVPLYTLVPDGDDADSDPDILCEIRRNTIYRIYATLNGKEKIVKMDLLDEANEFVSKEPVVIPPFN